MVTSHVSCPVLRQKPSNSITISHSTISMSHDYHSECDGHSVCSSNDHVCHSHCKSSIVSEKCGSDCTGRSSCSSNSSTSSADHYHHHHHRHSSKSTWREDLKSNSSFSNESYEIKEKAKVETMIRDDTFTAKSLTSTNAGNRGKWCCFGSSTTSRLTVFFFFSLCLLGAVAAFFCWPRTPRISMGGGAESLNGLAPDWWAGERSPIPSQDTTAIPLRPSLRATWLINVTLDNRDNWIPTHIKSLDFVMTDSLTLIKFAWASSSSMVLQPNTITPVTLTFNVNYQAADNMDPTFQNLYSACGPLKNPKDQRPALNVLLRVHFHIFGLLWTPIVTATPYTGGILCPVK